MTLLQTIILPIVASLFLLSQLTAKTFDVYPSGGALARVVALAHAGDTLLLHEGVYRESGIVVDKPLSLQGQRSGGAVVLDAENKGVSILFIRANNVSICGLTFKNVAVAYTTDNAAIRADNVRNCVIENNTLDNTFFGIYLAKSSFCRIANNVLTAHGSHESSSGNGVHLWRCDSITIHHNTVNGHRDGIYFEFVHTAVITQNLSTGNLRYGLHFMFSDSCVYEQNTFRRNGAGVAVMYTHNVHMVNNRFEDNWGAAAYGALFKDIDDSEVRGNVFVNNTIGLYAEGCNRSIIEQNEFLHNGYAVKIMANSMSNIFTHNTFEGNSFDVSTNSLQNYNTFRGNYWSRYQGYDLNHDGVGDVPFRPVRLFSLIVEQQAPALVLMHSLFVELLDIAERALPSLTPETLVDNEPLLKPYRKPFSHSSLSRK